MHARLIRQMVGALALAGGVAISGAARADDLLVFAAASLKTALDQVATDWRERTGKTVTISYAGSSSLARQIEQGAPAQVFISASVDWMDYLDKAGLIRSGTRVDLLSNSLVLIGHGSAAEKIELDADTDLAGLLGNEHLAMALVESVPAGVYGKAALTSLGLWDQVAAKVAQSDNVRAALALVSSGEAPYGIVYATDALADDNVSVVATFPPATHAPIVYPAAVVSTSMHPDAVMFLDGLSSPEATAVFTSHGFTTISGQGDG